MTKLNVVIMGQNCEKFLPMCLKSVQGADNIIFCDGGSTDNTLNILKENGFMFDNGDGVLEIETGWVSSKNKTNGSIYANRNRIIIHNNYDQSDKGMNGKQRNYYLDYLKKHHMGEWVLVLDADEVLDDIIKLKKFIDEETERNEYFNERNMIFTKNVISVKMRHFIESLGYEDATVKEHFVLNRLFIVKEDLIYPEVEHPVLHIKNGKDVTIEEYNERVGKFSGVTIWHLAYCPGMFEIKKRYLNHMKKSEMHTAEYLRKWRNDHLFGNYPITKVNPIDIPEIILNEFCVDKDELYFDNRGIELKNVLMVKQWNDYFKPNSVLTLGCGRGAYLYFWKWFANSIGIEKSKFAVDHAFCNDIICGDISDGKNYKKVDLITAIDVLEHLTDDELKKTLNNMKKFGTNFLFSIPFIDDPNLMADKTHKQFKTKENWIRLIESIGIKIKETPTNMLFSKQLLIGEKK